MSVFLDHIQIAIPEGKENELRTFYCAFLGLEEIPKPAALARRGGFWAKAGMIEVHFGVDPQFRPAAKAHPAFSLDDLDRVVRALETAGIPVSWDMALPDVRRCFVADPVGNRVELIAAA